MIYSIYYMAKRRNRHVTKRLRVSYPNKAKTAILYKQLTIKVPHKFKLTTNLGLQTSSAGGVLNAGVYCHDPSGCTDFSPLTSLFDSYRVTRVTLRFMPASTVNTFGSAGNYKPLPVVFDPDSTTNVASVDGALQYDNHKLMNVFKPWKYSVKPPFQTDNSVNNAGTQVSYYPGVGSMHDVGNVTYQHKGIISWYGDGFPALYALGTMYVTYYVTFASRR